jgi:hypothetical protein
MTTPYPDSLCQPLDVKNEQPVVWREELMPGHTIALRAVSLHSDHDIHAIHEWLSAGYLPDQLPIEQLRLLYLLIAECSYAQAFMVLLNDATPVGQFEIYQLLQDDVQDIIEASKGDYRLYIPVMPVIASHPEITLQILRNCLHYFFSFSEVKQIFWTVPVNDKSRNLFAGKLGFAWLQTFHEFFVGGSQEMNIWIVSNR